MIKIEAVSRYYSNEPSTERWYFRWTNGTDSFLCAIDKQGADELILHNNFKKEYTEVKSQLEELEIWVFEV